MAASRSETAQGFQFPTTNHLLITTPSQICSWDSATGVNTVFTSSHAGIVAAREAKDNSGILAVADKHVVVLHNTERGQEKSWGLHADEDEVRHLEYSADGKSLYLTTNLTPDIQRYSQERSQLLDPARFHASPPVALAVSPSGQLMVSASDHPPVVYLSNLLHGSSPILIESRTSMAAVSVISFHPERANIFLLAFRDGSVAAHDASRIGRIHGGLYANQNDVRSGEICSIRKLHRATTDGAKLASMTGAAFLPGFKTRAITVGSDGRCRVIDFAGKGEILRTWHAKAPATTVSVLSIKTAAASKDPFSRSRASHTIGGPTSTDNVIAIGREDGAVHLYDSVGILYAEKSLENERIISVEWVKGPSPRRIKETVVANDASNVPPLSLKPAEPGRPRNPTPSAQASVLAPTRRFTIHPDEEEEEGTVRHTPLTARAQLTELGGSEHLHLFSPAQPVTQTFKELPDRRVASPPRSRPRISSQTFMKSPTSTSPAPGEAVSGPRNLALFPSTDDTDETISPSSVRISPFAAQQRKTASFPLRQRITWKPSERRPSRKSTSNKRSQANDSVKMVPDMGKTSTSDGTTKPSGVLIGVNNIEASNRRRGSYQVVTDADSLRALREHRELTWVEDSEQGVHDGGAWVDEGMTDKEDPTPQFEPSSKDVRELFPRTSSLSPGKKKRRKPRGPSRDGKPRTLRELSLNTTDARQPHSPWERARNNRANVASEKQRPALVNDAFVTAGPRMCEGKGAEALEVRVIKLESEVARMRGELSSLASLLRRYGVPVPKTPG